MSASNRVLVSVVCIAVACALLSAPAFAKKCDKEGVTKVPAPYPCKGELKVHGTFKAPKDVWWGHQNRSYGNYLAFNKADIPKPPKRAKKAPKFQHILFDLDKSVLKPDATTIVDKVAAYLKANPKEKLHIQGHACDLASNDYNKGLGQRRANAVKRYLVEQGIDGKRLTTKSYGESKLLTTNAAKRMLNRRAVVLVCRDCCSTKK